MHAASDTDRSAHAVCCAMSSMLAPGVVAPDTIRAFSLSVPTIPVDRIGTMPHLSLADHLACWVIRSA